MKKEEGRRLAYKPPKWLYEIKDNRVWATVFAILFEHQYSNEPFTEESLKQEIADLDDLTESQAQEVFDLIVKHKDKL